MQWIVAGFVCAGAGVSFLAFPPVFKNAINEINLTKTINVIKPMSL